jgi:hypothetical protein
MKRIQQLLRKASRGRHRRAELSRYEIDEPGGGGSTSLSQKIRPCLPGKSPCN